MKKRKLIHVLGICLALILSLGTIPAMADLGESLGTLPLFTWAPLLINEGSSATFTADEGYTDYYWIRGSDPDDTCDNDPYYLENGRIMGITFGATGQYEVCLYDSEILANLIDRQWVTVTDVPATIDFVDIYPQPSLLGTPVHGIARVIDYDIGPFTCKVNWGDGAEQTFTTSERNECVLPNHLYAAAGIYTVEVSVSEAGGPFSAPGSDTVDVLYVEADPDADWLAADSLPTTITLWGFAAPGTASLTFKIATTPAYGTLGTPSTAQCQPFDKMMMDPGNVNLNNEAAQSPDTKPGKAGNATDIWNASRQALLPAAAPPTGTDPIMCTATVVYTPTPPGVGEDPYNGEDSFTFTVSDGRHTSLAGTIHLLVEPNTAPTAQDGSALVSSATPVYVALTASDTDFYNYLTDQLTFLIDSAPTHGTLSPVQLGGCLSSPGGTFCTSYFLYTPNPGTSEGTDSFTFHAFDTHQDSNVATVSLTLRDPVTLDVNTNDDVVDANGCDVTHCSLREAVDAAQVGDTIDFTLSLPNEIELTLLNGGILINNYISISGPGADQLAVSGGGTDDPESPGVRVFDFYNFSQPMNATISGLTIKDGRESEGSGIMVEHGATVTVSDCVIGPNNIATYAGGGISNVMGTLTLNRSTVVSNYGTATYGGAGIFTAGGLTTLINSTVSGNVTNNLGGGILSVNGGTVSLIHSTVSGNTANANATEPGQEWGGGGGIYIQGGYVEIQNSLVAGNFDLSTDDTPMPDVSGDFTSLGGNLIGDGTGSSGWLASDQVGTALLPIDPKLDVLAVNNPGLTPTYALLTDSPAIDKVTCLAGVTTDQNSVPRPQGPLCDIGAYELPRFMTIHNITLTSKAAGSTFAFTGLVTIDDDLDGSLLNKVAVTVEWSKDGIVFQPRTAPMANTNRNGEAKFTLRGQPAGLYQMCVTNVVKMGWYWEPMLSCASKTVP